jgi:RNA polymerase sigma-70 factor (ECF subfamily)
MVVGPEVARRNVGSDDDTALMVSVAGGDKDGLARLYDRYAPLLTAVAIRMLGSRREAEDLVHDVFLEVWRQSGDYDAARGTVRTWILMRMRSRALDRRKSVHNSRVDALDERHVVESVVDEDATLAADRGRVRRALAGLPDEQRAVLQLAYFEGLSSQEIAERVGIPVGTVKSRVAAAMARLRAELLPGGGRS